jgi:hypothetical protein
MVFCTALLAGEGQGQAPTDSAGTTPTLAAAADGWVVDSTPPRKGRRQTFWAAVAAGDSVIGKYRTTRPVLQLFCHSNIKKVGLQIQTGQLISGRYPSPLTGSRVGRTGVLIQRDDGQEQQAGWLFHMDTHVIGPDENNQGKTVEEAVAAGRYRLGVMLNPVGRRYMEFDLTGIAERVEWVASHCGAKPV